MFERFTERARQVVVLAQDEARELRHGYIGTEHLLLGLVREEEGLAARVLESLDVGAEDVRSQIRSVVGEGDEVPAGQIPFTPRAKKTLEQALRQALALKHNYIGTEHVLLGLLEDEKAVGARILAELGVAPEQIRELLLGMLSGARSGERLTPSRRGWAYRVELLDDQEALTADFLDSLGMEGWELVAVVGEPPGARLVFKQPARS
jgi:ATP-dependent Clp protease ATP-binding subunit ClpC